MSKLRGCGRRVKGGVYAETRLGRGGIPISEFIVEPTEPLDTEALGLSAIGVKLVELSGVTHVLDMVGGTHYPYVADMVAEVLRMGASRRLPRTLDFSRLTGQSRLLLVHSKAWLTMPGKREDEARLPSLFRCPKYHGGVALHPPVNDTQVCAGMWFSQVHEDDLTDTAPARQGYGVDGVRRVGSTLYQASNTGMTCTLNRKPAIFMALPITNIAVVRADDGSHEAAVEKASRAAIGVEEVDE